MVHGLDGVLMGVGEITLFCQNNFNYSSELIC